MSRSDISLSVGISLFGDDGLLGGGLHVSHSTASENLNQYMTSRSQSSIVTHGGPLFKPANFSVNDWVDGVGDNLVVIDRSGIPLNFFVTAKNFPELPLSLVEKVADAIDDAIGTYYKYNSIKGCMDVNSPSFHFEANIDDGTCKDAGANLTFGGIYQTCNSKGNLNENLCDGLTTTNSKTGAATCPEGYTSTLLFEGTVSKVETHQECKKFLFWHYKCHNVNNYGSATYETFWCVAVDKNTPSASGYLFGGLYTSASSNPLSNSHACPPTFKSVKILSDLYICLSDEYENSLHYSARFGGLFSCQQGNPLASKNPDLYTKACPVGYSERLAVIEDGCEVMYCVKASSPSVKMVVVKSPPFIGQNLVEKEGSTFLVNSQGNNWTSLYQIPDNISKYSDDMEGWISSDGENINLNTLLFSSTEQNSRTDLQFAQNSINNSEINIKKLLGRRDDSTNSYSIKDERSEAMINSVTSKPKEGEAENIVTNRRRDTQYSGMTTFEVAMLVTLSIIATLLCVIFASIIVVWRVRSNSDKNKRYRHDSQSELQKLLS